MNYIKIIVYKVVRLFLRLFCILPIKRNRLMFESYKGGSYSCNPKYICEFILEHYSDDYEIIWVFKNPDKIAVPKGIKKIKKRSFNNFFYHMTAKVIITNMTDDVYIPKRKKQVVINTWHAGGAYKKVGLSYGKTFTKLTEWQDNTVRNETSYYISSSDLFTKYNIIEAYKYNGKVIKSGMPRNDIFFDEIKMEAIRAKLENQFNIRNKTVILYAPTFRGDFGHAQDVNFVFPFERIINAFNSREEKVIILNRSHYSVHSIFKKDLLNVVDVTAYPDMQELLVVADILVTDYSSSIWDFSLTGKPCILFVPDKDKYILERGTYTSIEKWPGKIAVTEDVMIESLLTPDYEWHKRKSKNSLLYYNSYETGTAAKEIVDLIGGECAK